MDPSTEESPGAATPTGSSAGLVRLAVVALLVLAVLALGWWLINGGVSRSTTAVPPVPTGAVPTVALGNPTSLAVDTTTLSTQAGVPSAATPVGAVPTPVTGTNGTATAPVERLKVQVLSERPHDPAAFTQGLVWREGELYESTGLYGQSTLRRVDPATGAVQQKVDLPPDRFGEGLALVGDRLIQLTWQEHVAMVYDRRTFQRQNEFSYDGEGWGLCFDGSRLIRSDGSPLLYFHDPDTFAVTGQLAVTLEGQPLPRLNELECVGNDVYANIWQTDQIARIDKATGQVTAMIDAGGLLTPAEKQPSDVLNGIAYDYRDGTFLITGKLWPKLFEVQFVPAGGQ